MPVQSWGGPRKKKKNPWGGNPPQTVGKHPRPAGEKAVKRLAKGHVVKDTRQPLGVGLGGERAQKGTCGTKRLKATNKKEKGRGKGDKNSKENV